jgi:tensin
VFFLNTVNVESRSGLDAITYALNNTKAFINKDSSQLLLIQFKVTSQGITLTDMNRKKFIRQNFPTNTVNYCAVDEKLAWPLRLEKIDKPR